MNAINSTIIENALLGSVAFAIDQIDTGVELYDKNQKAEAKKLAEKQRVEVQHFAKLEAEELEGLPHTYQVALEVANYAPFADGFGGKTSSLCQTQDGLQHKASVREYLEQALYADVIILSFEESDYDHDDVFAARIVFLFTLSEDE